MSLLSSHVSRELAARSLKFGSEDAQLQCVQLASDVGMNAEDIADLCEAALSGGRSSVVDLAVVKRMVSKVAMSSKGRASASSAAPGASIMMDADDVGDTSFETMLGLGDGKPASAAGYGTPASSHRAPGGTASAVRSARNSRRESIGSGQAPMHSGTASRTLGRSGSVAAGGGGAAASSSSTAPSTPAPRAQAASAPGTGGRSAPGTAYKARKNAGDVVATFDADGQFGDESSEPYVPVARDTLAARGAWAVSTDTTGALEVRPVLAKHSRFGAGTLPGPFKYMFTTPDRRAEALDARCEVIGRAILKAKGLQEEGLSGVSDPSQSEVVVCGRVMGETDGKLKPSQLLLEGSIGSSEGARARLRVDEVPSFSLFPGQVVVAKGINSDGNCVVAKEIMDAAPLGGAKTAVPVVTARAEHAETTGSGPMRMWAASGPFCTHDDLEFQPLLDLLMEAQHAECPPDVVVLQGPFLDDSHPACRRGTIRLPNDDGVVFSITFQDLWELRVLPAMEEALMSPALSKTRIVIVPATTGVLGEPVFPQPSLETAMLAGMGDAAKERVTLLPNPCTFSVGGMVFSTVAEDVLRDLGAQSTFKHAAGSPRPQRIPQLASQLLEQRSFYPVFPPSEGLPLDLAQQAHVAMPLKPDVLLLPSRLAPFVKEISGTVVVSHGQLCRSRSAGFYCRLEVHSYADPSAAGADGAGGEAAAGKKKRAVSHEAAKRVRASVIRIYA